MKRKRKYVANRLVTNNRILNNDNNWRKTMKELAQRFIGKDTYIKLLDGNADGIIKEVTDSGIVLENKGNLQVINLNYVIKISEIPYKNGKRSSFFND